jgi:glutamine synthetase adenylyltransferase
MPGRDNAEKANAVGRKLVSWVAENGLKDGFFFRVDADDFGVQVLEASD